MVEEIVGAMWVDMKSVVEEDYGAQSGGVQSRLDGDGEMFWSGGLEVG
jgi:hypothetical protein